VTSVLLDPVGVRPDAARPDSARPDPDSPLTRIVDATLRCIARWGLSKTTVDDIAREAGLGRATLYRLFPGGRDAVLDAVLATETGRFFGHLESCLTATESLEDALTVIVSEAGRALSDHRALQFLLAHEPEIVLPHISFQQFDAVLGVIAGNVGPLLARWLPADAGAEVAPRGAEWLARIVLSYLCAPSPDVDLTDADSVRRLVRAFILPGLAPADT
jgi:AcrR family transcriptional regulator